MSEENKSTQLPMEFPFKEILQHYSQTGRSGLFNVSWGHCSGQIFIQSGLAIYAETASETGEKAFMEIISWPEVQYKWDDTVSPETVNMSHAVEDLLVQHILLENNRPAGRGPVMPDAPSGPLRSDTRTIPSPFSVHHITLDIASTELAPFTFVAKSHQIRVGREAGTNDLAIPDSSVSRKHALVIVTQDTMLVRDLGSKNGTFIDGQPISQGIARHGQVVSFGEVHCRITVNVGLKRKTQLMPHHP
jgi:hypothetical protein